MSADSDEFDLDVQDDPPGGPLIDPPRWQPALSCDSTP
jgi:hypothetical protein